MNKLEQFEKVIKNLENEAEIMKSHSEIFSKIKLLQNQYEIIINKIEDSKKNLERGIIDFGNAQSQILTNMQASNKKFDGFLNETQNKTQNEYKVIQQNQSLFIKEIERSKNELNELLSISKISISGELGNIRSNQEKISSNFKENFEKTSTLFYNQLDEIKKSIEAKIDILRQVNIQNYKDLDSTLRIKLDDNKSEIKRLIENERFQIKELIEESNKELGDKILNHQKNIQTLVWIVGGILAFLNIIIFIKMFY